MILRAIDLDGIPAGIEGQAVSIVDAGDLADGLRLFAGRRAWRDLQDRLPPVETGARRAEVVFYGSGDFHHVSAALVARHAGPLSILHIDNHPDWVAFPKGMNCGAWVNRVLERPDIARVLTLGPASNDLVRPQLSFARLRAVEADRIRLHPWSHPPSRVWGRFADCPSWTVGGGRLHWRTLSGLEDEAMAALVLAGLATRDVYVTLDKDALSPADAATNWEQGGLPLRRLAVLLEAVAERHRIVGVDVCGDWSQPRMADPARWFISLTDRPAAVPPADHRVINQRTNEALVSLFKRLLG